MAPYEDATGLKATTGIELLTHGTSNGYKASIMLSELALAYSGFEFSFQSINISKNIQKQPWFTTINPNGRIPAIVDHNRGGVAIWEGIAILGYLARRYDTEHKVSFPVGSDEYDEAEVWMAWQHGGVGPMQGQAGHFALFSPQKIPYAAQRYVGETERLYGILNARLDPTLRDYVAGSGRGRFSTADMSLLGWAAASHFQTINMKAQFPNVAAWVQRCIQREGVKRGLDIPSKNLLLLDPDSPEFQEEVDKLGGHPMAKGLGGKLKNAKEFVEAAKKEFGYVYTSP